MKDIHDIKPVCDLEGCEEEHNQRLSDSIDQMGELFDQIDDHMDALTEEV